MPSTNKDNALDAVFRPRSVAVVGASRREQNIGREILQNMVAGVQLVRQELNLC